MPRNRKPTHDYSRAKQLWMLGGMKVPEIAKATGIPARSLYQHIAREDWEQERDRLLLGDVDLRSAIVELEESTAALSDQIEEVKTVDFTIGIPQSLADRLLSHAGAAVGLQDAAQRLRDIAVKWHDRAFAFMDRPGFDVDTLLSAYRESADEVVRPHEAYSLGMDYFERVTRMMSKIAGALDRISVLQARGIQLEREALALHVAQDLDGSLRRVLGAGYKVVDPTGRPTAWESADPEQDQEAEPATRTPRRMAASQFDPETGED
jgi:hypothetical protein